MSEYKLNSNLVTRSNIDKTDNIKNNNFNTPWKISTTHICHDPDSYGNINYYNQNGEIEFNNLDASNNNLYIENKKNDTIISVNENKKIKFEGITEFSNNSFFNGNIICNNILDISSIYTYSISSEIIKANEIEGDITFKGNVTIDGEFSKSGEDSTSLNLFNSNIIDSNIVNSKIGISKTGEILRENAYIDILNTNDISINNNLLINNNISINNNLLINNNIFLKNIENNNFNYINFESISVDTSFNLKFNGINNILINNIEYDDSNKFYLENTNYLINNKLEFEFNFAIYIKNTNNANIISTDSNIFTENYNNKNYNIIINNSDNVNLNKEFNLNITGNFEYIDIIVFTGNNLNDGIIIKTFENIFLYKHDIDLLNKLNIIDNSINELIINNFSNNSEFNYVNIKNNLDVIENTILHNSLEVYNNSILQDLSAGATDISSTLNVTGAVTFDNTLDVAGDTSVSTFDSTGATSLATDGGPVNISSSGQMTTIKGTLDVAGDTSVTTFDSTGATSLATGGGEVNIASSGQLTKIKGTLDVAGDTSVTTFDSTGATSLATDGGEVNIASLGQMTTIKGKLNVVEPVTLNSTLQIGSGLKGGQIYATQTDHELVIDPFALDINSDSLQDASGVVTILGDLIVKGNTTTFHSVNVDISDHLLKIASGSTSAGQSNGAGIKVGDGYATFTYNSAGSGSWRSNIGLHVTGDTSVTTFDSTGATSLATNGGSVNIASAGASTIIEGTLNVNEAVICDTTLSVSKNNDTTHYLGKAKIGYIGSGYEDYAVFCHHDLDVTGYSLIQNNFGETSLNSETGKNLDFRIGNNPKMTLNSNGNVGIGITTPSTLLHVNGNATINGSLSMQSNDITNVSSLQVGGVSNAHVPSGVIVMWYGSESNIPTGWTICNGQNNTPDLRDRFIIGAGNQYQVNDTGGQEKVTLQESELPSHRHYIDSDVISNGGHNHQTVNQNSRYGYEGPKTDNYNSSDDSKRERLICLTDGDNKNYKTDVGDYWDEYIFNQLLTDYHQGHTHEIKTHTQHTGQTNSHENKPPYYALYYIMKL